MQIMENQKPTWVKYVHQRIKNNKNFLCMFSGPTGTGKSWSALSYCEQLDENFGPDQIVFTAKELMDLINSGTLKKGSCILFDEAGIDLGSRTWQSLTNRLLNYLIQTFRHKNFVLIFTSPYSDFIDSQTRRLFHAEFETVSIDTINKTVKVKPKSLKYNAKMKKTYERYLITSTPEGQVKKKRWNIPKPSDELIEKYEEKKTEFTGKLNNDIAKKINEIADGRTPLSDAQKEVARGIYELQTTEQNPLAHHLGKSQSTISDSLKIIKKKGYKPKEFLKHPPE